MHLTWRGILVLGAGLGVAAASFVGCGSDDELPKVDCTMGAVPKFSEMTVWQKCTPCHASTLKGAARQDAPGDVNFDTAAGAKASGKQGASEVKEGSMPRGGYKVTDDEKQALYKWAQCGMPE